MAKVLTDNTQFSDNDQIKIANELGKLSIRIVDLFSQGIDLIPSAEYEMEHDVRSNLLPKQHANRNSLPGIRLSSLSRFLLTSRFTNRPLLLS